MLLLHLLFFSHFLLLIYLLPFRGITCFVVCNHFFLNKWWVCFLYFFLFFNHFLTYNSFLTLFAFGLFITLFLLILLLNYLNISEPILLSILQVFIFLLFFLIKLFFLIGWFLFRISFLRLSFNLLINIKIWYLVVKSVNSIQSLKAVK